jgi:hypothetical protein
MSHWNYRVVRKASPDTDSVSYQVHEVYYTKAGGIEGWTENPVAPSAESPAALREDIRWFLQAFRRPILEARLVDGREQLVADESDQPINKGHYFELMDRAAVALDYVYQFLGSHPLMKQEPKLSALYDKAESVLSDLYQEAGRLEFEHHP